MDLRHTKPGVALAVGLILVLASLIIVFCLFDNFTMNWLDPFSMICMDRSDVTVTTIWNKATVDSFLFCIHQTDIVCLFCSSLLSVQFRLFVLHVVVKRTILSVRFARRC